MSLESSVWEDITCQMLNIVLSVLTWGKKKMVHEVVRKFNAKSSNNKLRQISISFDCTPKHYFKKVMSELRWRQNNGENNLNIRVTRGIPKIISLNRNSPTVLRTYIFVIRM